MVTVCYDGQYPPLKDFTTIVPCDKVAHGFVLDSAIDLIKTALAGANLQYDSITFTTQEIDGLSVFNHWKVQMQNV